MKKEKDVCLKNALKNINYRLNFLKLSREKVLLDIKIIRERIKDQLELKETTDQYLKKMTDLLHAKETYMEIRTEEQILNTIKKEYENE